MPRSEPCGGAGKLRSAQIVVPAACLVGQLFKHGCKETVAWVYSRDGAQVFAANQRIQVFPVEFARVAQALQFVANLEPTEISSAGKHFVHYGFVLFGLQRAG